MTDCADAESTNAHSKQWLDALLARAVQRKASDLFLKTDAPPSVRVDGRVRFIKDDPVGARQMERIAEAMLGSRMDELREMGDVDLAYQLEGVGRFRVNVFRQSEKISAAFRYIPMEIPTFEELNLPREQLEHLSSQRSGIVLVTGVTGSGKSTTLASMVQFMNRHYGRHIITIEDPIEFVHGDGKCLIEQREVGIDTPSFERALRHVVRQSPDVILIGEMRDRETIETAINAAEIGHLVLSTLHTDTARQALARMVSYFPPYRHELIRTQLSSTVQGILSQKLLLRADVEGRLPAVEIMMRSPIICELIQKNQIDKLRAAMREDTFYGSQTYNEVLKELYESGKVELEQALAASDRPQEMKNELHGLSMR
ncbi:MAG: PilT/PilU family type 4a pilus ATPase [Planctomycetes bacterium]|nr:PilT/PilU family type 4a pilus ATPase [Planctomycetota bacterium]